MVKVICIGELLWDCVAPTQDQPDTAIANWTEHLGGAPANVACGLQQLDCPAAIVSCVGADAAGQKLKAQCQQRGVDVQGVQQHLLLPTRQVQIIRDTSGERTFGGFGIDAPADFADRHIQAAALPVDLFANAEYLVFGTVAWAAPESRLAISQALELADQFQVKVFLDVNWRPLFWEHPETAPALIQQLWSRIDFLKLSAEEAQFLFETTDAAAIATRVESLEGVWVTDGGDGPISYYLSGQAGQVQPFPVTAVDTTGAGDSFVAGVIAQLCHYGLAASTNRRLAQTITTYGAAVGALSTTQTGAIAAQPTPEQVEQFLTQVKKS